MTKVLMGIDAGTESVRVGFYDIKGNELSFANAEYKTYHEHPGWAEQKPEDWWSCLKVATKKAMEKGSIEKESILGISMDTTCCSVVACKDDGTPLRNSIIWMDVRAGEQAEKITKTDHRVLQYNGFGNVSAEWMPCKAMWIKENEPEIYNQAEKVCEFTDWYTYKLTGRWTGNICNTSARWYYNRLEGGWPVDFYETIGLGDLIEKFPEEILDLGDKVAGLSEEAAEELGLVPGTIVGQGGVDAFIGMIGLGVVKPGSIAFITGSSHLILGLADRNFHAPGVWGTYPDAVIKGLGLVEGGQTSSGSMIKWFKNNFCGDLEALAEKEGMNVYEYMTPEAEKVGPGAEGLLIMDWWQGNRTPYTDPNVRGMIYGLSLKHTKEHIFRAMMEGIAFGSENILQSFRQNGMAPTELYAAGGATNSDLFLQIHADVSNVTIHVPEVKQAPCLGSAILASVTAGVYDTIEEAVANMVRFEKTIEPNKENHKIYQELFAQYQDVYPQFKDWMVKTSSIASR